MLVQYKIKCEESKVTILKAVQSLNVEYDDLKESLVDFIEGKEILNHDPEHPYPSCDSTGFDLSEMLQEAMEAMPDEDYQGLEGIHDRLSMELEQEL